MSMVSSLIIHIRTVVCTVVKCSDA